MWLRSRRGSKRTASAPWTRSSRRTMKWPRAIGLEMVGEDDVDRCAADRAENRHRLGGELLADEDANRAATCADQPHQIGAVSPATPRCSDEPGALADRSRERGANGEIAALDRRVAGRLTAERENLDAGERGLRARQILALLAGDLGDRSQQDRRRNRQFDRQWRRGRRRRRGRRKRPRPPCARLGGLGRRSSVDRAHATRNATLSALSVARATAGAPARARRGRAPRPGARAERWRGRRSCRLRGSARRIEARSSPRATEATASRFWSSRRAAMPTSTPKRGPFARQI